MRDWLGFSRGEAVVGLYVSPTHVSMAVMRPNPLRLIALGRQLVFDAAVVDDEVRLTRALAADLAALAEQIRLPATAGVVVTIEPNTALTAVGDEDGASCTVRQQTRDRLVGAVHRSGLRLLRVDPVPAALARLGRLTGPGVVALRGGFGWSVMTGPGYTEAERNTDGTGAGLETGPDPTALRPLEVDQLPIKIPRRIRPAVDLGRDAVAIGAALAGFDLRPLVEVRVVAEPAGRNWAVRSVTGVSRQEHRQRPPEPRLNQAGQPTSSLRPKARLR